MLLFPPGVIAVKDIFHKKHYTISSYKMSRYYTIKMEWLDNGLQSHLGQWLMQVLPKPEGSCGAFVYLYLRYACPPEPRRRRALCPMQICLERKTMREVIFESLKWYITPMETAARSDKKKKVKKKDWKRGRTDVEATGSFWSFDFLKTGLPCNVMERLGLSGKISHPYRKFWVDAGFAKISSVCHPSLLAKVNIELEKLQREKIVG